MSAYGRAEVVGYGDYRYDHANTQGQSAYALAHLRGGIRSGGFFLEAWTRNAFDKMYIPIALPYPGAPSGYIGENGPGRTFGVRAGAGF
jgi:hypothetical protein